MSKQLSKIFILSLLISGCSILSPVTAPEVKSFQISGLNSESSSASCTKPSVEQTLQITQMRAVAPYDTTKMLYSASEYELNSYAYNQWITFPARMLSSIMFEKVAHACIYNNVVNAELMTQAMYRLDTQLLELKQVIGTTHTTISLKILAQVVDNQTNTVLKTKTFVIVNETQADPKGYVMGVNQAASEFLAQLVLWLKE